MSGLRDYAAALADQARAAGATALRESDAKVLLSAAGLSVPAGLAAAAPEGFDQTALACLRPPLVAKILTAEGAHKSDIGGVRLGLANADEALAAVADIAGTARRAGVIPSGFLIEEQAPPGHELVLGGLYDLRFGPCVMLGLGGVFVEIFEDVAFRVCPITERDARDMLNSLRAAPLLRGARGRTKADEDAVVAALLAFGGEGGLLQALDGEAAEIDINPLIAHQQGAVAADARIILAHERMVLPPPVPPLDAQAVREAYRPLFRPRSIAVLGASATGSSFGNEVIRHSRAFGYAGAIRPVHPKAETVEGLPAFPSLSSLPEPADFAYVAVAAEAAIESIAAAPGAARFIQVMSSGFGETEAGRAREARLIEAARKAGARLIGPNCLGVHSPLGGLTFVGGASPEPGSVGVISQSGGLAVDVILRGEQRGLRFSGVTTLGNSADLGPADLLEHHLADPETRVIGLYLEDVRDGRRFFARLREARAAKPVVLLVGGATAAGRRAAASHTGSLAADARLWAGLARQTGALLTETLDEFLDALLILCDSAGQPPRPIRRVALFGNGGGASVLAADALARAGLETPEVPPEARARLDVLGLPPGTGLDNPIDTPAGTLRYREGAVAGEILDILVDAGCYDAIVLHVNLPVFTTSSNQSVDVIGGLVRETVRVRTTRRDAPRLVLVLRSDGAEATEARRRTDRATALAAGVPVFGEIPEAARALAALARREAFRASL